MDNLDDPNQPPPDNQDQQDDAELMRALGAEVKAYVGEQNAILFAQIDERLSSQEEIFSGKMDLEREILGARLDLQKEILSSQTEILNAIRALQITLASPKVIVDGPDGRPAGIRIVS